MDDTIKRIERCENKIDDLSREVAENTVNMEFMKDIVNKFEKTQDETVKTLIKIQGAMDTFKGELGDIKQKVDKNEELNTVDLREIQKNGAKSTLERIMTIITPLTLIGFLLYLLLGK